MELLPDESIIDYRTMFPAENETVMTYARRLEAAGHEEMFIRKALRAHFGFQLGEAAEMFEEFELARLRHLQLLRTIAPNRTEYSFRLKVAKNLGISDERAAYWVSRLVALEAAERRAAKS